MDTEKTQLVCHILATAPELQRNVLAWLLVSQRVADVQLSANQDSLCNKLAQGQSDLAVIVVDNRRSDLPACLLRYPDLRVLVLTESRRTGSIMAWLHQGATDVVSLAKPDAVQHSISRLLDELILRRQQLELQQCIKEQQKLIESLQSCVAKTPTDDHKDTPDTDSVTGLPVRENILARLQQMLLSSSKSSRYTAMLVEVAIPLSGSRQTGVERTMQELALYRAAHAIESLNDNDSVLGRVNDNALLLMRRSNVNQASRDSASQVRKLLGSLGGLLDPPKDVRINTLNLSATSMSAAEVVARLERR